LYELLEVIASVGFVVEGAVELCLIGLVQNFGEVGAGLDIEFDQVAAEQDGFGGIVLDGECLGLIEQPVAFGEVDMGEGLGGVGRGETGDWGARGQAQRGASVFVGMGHAHQAVHPFDAGSEAAQGGVAGTVAVEGERAHVLLNQREDFLENFLLPGQAPEKAAG